jgi:hypothetical protein
MIPPLVALLAWVPIGLVIFRSLPIRTAVLINFIGGWAILPAANYTYDPRPFPYWILGTSLESDYLITKATILGLTGILGVFFFDRGSFKRFRLTVWDLAMGMWLIAPLLSAIANPDARIEGLEGEAYQLLAWGSPYLIGRLYFTNAESLRLVAKAFVIGGLAYAPLCIFEIVAGPRLYVWLYGYLPFQMNGATRFIGYRPVVFLENGNQLGIWMATSTLIALWLWRRKTASAILGMPIAMVAILLFAVTLFCQSTGAIILLLALIPFVFVDPRHLSRTFGVALVLGILAFAGFRIANIVSVHELVKENDTARAANTFMNKIGKQSLGWRLTEDERHIETALAEPILGYGQWDWWHEGIERPWSLWLLVFGLYGSVGLISMEAMLLIPVVRAIWVPLARSDIGYTNMRHTLSAAVLISAIDSLLNSSFILPLMLVIGGMTIWTTTDAEVELDLAQSKIPANGSTWRTGSYTGTDRRRYPR